MSDHTTRDSSTTIPYGYCQCGCGQKTNLAESTDSRLGHIKGEPYRFVAGHQRRKVGLLADVLWALVEEKGKDDCWEWHGLSVCNGGYGKFEFRGKTYRAHRLAYELTYGPIRKGLQCLHRCDNPSCCNPAHLFVGTIADNMHDKAKKGRQARGERQGRAKLTANKVGKIRVLDADGVSHSEIARRFNVHPKTIKLIVSRKTWKHVP